MRGECCERAIWGCDGPFLKKNSWWYCNGRNPIGDIFWSHTDDSFVYHVQHFDTKRKNINHCITQPATSLPTQAPKVFVWILQSPVFFWQKISERSTVELTERLSASGPVRPWNIWELQIPVHSNASSPAWTANPGGFVCTVEPVQFSWWVCLFFDGWGWIILENISEYFLYAIWGTLQNFGWMVGWNAKKLKDVLYLENSNIKSSVINMYITSSAERCLYDPAM